MLIMLAISISLVMIVFSGSLLIWTAAKDSNEALWFRLMEMIAGLIAFAISLPIFAFLLTH